MKGGEYMKKILMIVGGIIVIAVIAYGGYRIMHHLTKQPAPTMQATKMKPSSSPTVQATQNSVYKMMTKDKLGMVMTDPKGITLYTYAKDTTGASTCSGKCADNWPAYVAPSQTGSFPENISVIKRTDGMLQYAWKNMPLYYYIKDKDSGDAYGNGVGGVWSVIKP